MRNIGRKKRCTERGESRGGVRRDRRGKEKRLGRGQKWFGGQRSSNREPGRKVEAKVGPKDQASDRHKAMVALRKTIQCDFLLHRKAWRA